jgi:erythromycin esterase
VTVAAEEAAAPDDPAAAVRAWVARRAVPLAGTAAGAEPEGEDLAAIAAALEGVRVVGLGEATHGTSEFFTLRHRLLRHLVRTQGFRVLAFESYHAGAHAVDDYVRGGESTLEEALAGLGMRLWRVEEVAALLRWLREYNRGAEPADRVRFVGVDMQGIDRPAARLAAYLARVEPERADEQAAFYAGLTAAAERMWAGEEGALKGLPAELDARLADFTLARGRYVARSSVAEYQRLLKDLCILAQFARGFGGGEAGAAGPADARDRYLADNVLTILADEPTAKVALFAHNAHVQRGQLVYQPAEHFGAGEHLARDLGSAYYAMGLCFGEGSFQALQRTPEGDWQFDAYEVGPPPEGTVEWMFADAGAKDAFLDLRRATPPEPVRAWLDAARGLRWVGGYGVPANIGEQWKLAGSIPQSRVAREYDGLIFVARGRRASPLP